MRRWRNGEELSHVMVVHGSVVVGMLRDWRAVSCLGSNVVEDECEVGVVVERRMRVRMRRHCWGGSISCVCVLSVNV